MKDSINADLETQIRNLQREITTLSQPVISVPPVESMVPKIDFERTDQELQLVRRRLDSTIAEVNRRSNEIENFI